MDLRLENRLALISGSTAGIGYAIAEGLAREGARVIVNGRQQDSVDDAAKRIRAATGQDALGFAGDLATAAAAEALVQAHPGIEILVNNLGTSSRSRSRTSLTPSGCGSSRYRRTASRRALEPATAMSV